jgi:Flp pilus assembly pilin Flp
MKIKKLNSGIGIVEYSLILALLALIVLGIFVTVGKNTGEKISLYVHDDYKASQQ